MTRTYRWALSLVLLAVVLVMISPILWLVSSSLKSSAEMASFPPTWWPSQPRFANYTEAISSVNFLGAAQNSLTIAFISTTLTTLSSAWVGFGFARLTAPGKKQLFVVLLGDDDVAGDRDARSDVPDLREAAHGQHLLALGAWGLGGSAFLIFLFRQFFAGIPREMEEAAIIDGCGYVGIFWRIFLPQSWPVIAASVILSFTHAWGDFVGPAMFLSQDSTTLAVAMATGYVNDKGLPMNNLVAAGAVMYVLPVLILFLFMQRRFVSGFSTSGIK